MERKIGEIFEYNGEWLQCVKQPEKYDKTVCAICAFQGNGNCELDRCSGTYRSDKKSVIFKKLEKVGEPYMLEDKKFQKYRVFHTPYIYNKIDYSWQSFADPYYVSLELKQNKEDMEEKYSELTDIVHEYMDKDMTYKDFKEAINDWVDDYVANKESDKPTLKPFDLQQAKDGKPFCTRDGRKARIICFDIKNDDYPLVAAVEEHEGKEVTLMYTNKGFFYKSEKEDNFDLMMLPEKKEGWVNVYKDSVYDTKDEALIGRSEIRGYIDTINISWEE